MAVVYGVDGCRGGRLAWLVVPLYDDRSFGPAAVAASFEGVLPLTRDAELVLVDIPIGLPEPGRPTRTCDVEARRILGPRRSSVFPAPSRAALHAADHRAASDANRQAIGRGLSLQAWGICPRIADVDAVLRARSDLRPRYRESHPEVCFAGLNAWRPMEHPKRDAAGVAERVGLLSRHARNAHQRLEDTTSRWRRAAVGPDDVLDAMVLAVVARQALSAGCPALPADPVRDAHGLPMEMVCPTRYL